MLLLLVLFLLDSLYDSTKESNFNPIIVKCIPQAIRDEWSYLVLKLSQFLKRLLDGYERKKETVDKNFSFLSNIFPNIMLTHFFSLFHVVSTAKVISDGIYYLFTSGILTTVSVCIA